MSATLKSPNTSRTKAAQTKIAQIVENVCGNPTSSNVRLDPKTLVSHLCLSEAGTPAIRDALITGVGETISRNPNKQNDTAADKAFTLSGKSNCQPTIQHSNQQTKG